MTIDSFFPLGHLSWCPRPLVLRLLILDPFGVRVDWSSLFHALVEQGMWWKGFESPILSSFSDFKSGEILANWFSGLYFLFCILVVKMGFLVFI